MYIYIYIYLYIYTHTQDPSIVGSPPSAHRTIAGRAKGRPKKNQDTVVVVNAMDGCGVDLYGVLYISETSLELYTCNLKTRLLL